MKMQRYQLKDSMSKLQIFAAFDTVDGIMNALIDPAETTEGIVNLLLLEKEDWSKIKDEVVKYFNKTVVNGTVEERAEVAGYAVFEIATFIWSLSGIKNAKNAKMVASLADESVAIKNGLGLADESVVIENGLGLADDVIKGTKPPSLRDLMLPDEAARYDAYLYNAKNGKYNIPYEMTADEYYQYLKGLDKVDEAIKGGSYTNKVKSIMSTWNEIDVQTYNKLSVAEKQIYIKAIRNEPHITQELQEIVKAYGGYLDGLEYRLKSPSSVFEKIYVRPEKTPIVDMNDIVRYTEIQNPDKLVSSVQGTISDLEKNGYEIIKLKNTWIDDTTPYQGINAQIISPDGQSFELQFHTPESFALKNSEEMHGLYEQTRVLHKLSKEYVTLTDKMFELSDMLEVPKDIKSIKSFRR
jgi:hypothetical protein